MTESAYIDVTIDNQVMTIRMNRPEKKNAISRDMYDAITHSLGQADLRDDVGVVMLCGLPESFTVGNDLDDFNKRVQGELSPGSRFLLAIHDLKKPIIAGISGLAVGVGVTMLQHCDLVYAADTTRLRMPFVNLGVCPEAGSSLILPSVSGLRAASELLLLGDFFTAETAFHNGIVTGVVPAGELEAVLAAKAAQLAAQPRRAVIETKKLLKQVQYDAVRARILEESDLFGELLLTDESIQARQNVLKKK